MTDIHTGYLTSCSLLLNCCSGTPRKECVLSVCVRWGARCSLCPTVSKDLMRDLTVAPGSDSASPLASEGVVGIMEMPHQWRLLSESDTLPSSPWDLTDKRNWLLCRQTQYIQCKRQHVHWRGLDFEISPFTSPLTRLPAHYVYIKGLSVLTRSIDYGKS